MDNASPSFASGQDPLQGYSLVSHVEDMPLQPRQTYNPSTFHAKQCSTLMQFTGCRPYPIAITTTKLHYSHVPALITHLLHSIPTQLHPDPASLSSELVLLSPTPFHLYAVHTNRRHPVTTHTQTPCDAIIFSICHSQKTHSKLRKN